MNMSDYPVNILLVDDHPANLTALSLVLYQASYNLIQAKSGEEALSYLQSNDFAVVLLDVMMPGMDGYEVAKIMKSQEKTKYTPIIFVTAVAMDTKYIFEGYSVGAVDYVPKPIEPTIIRGKVAVFADLFRKNEFIRNSERAQYLEREHEARISAEKAQKRFLDLANSLDHAVIWEANLELSYFSFMSKRAEQLLGYPHDQWNSEAHFFINHVHPNDKSYVLTALHQAQNPHPGADDLGERCEHRMIAADGSERWFHTGIQMTRNEHGIPTGLRGLSVDIQALKGVEHALRDSQEQLDFALRAARMGMWDWNLITNSFYCSDTMKELCGFSLFEYPPSIEAIRAHIHPEDREKHRSELQKAMNGQEKYDVEYRILLPDGSIRWISSKGRAFFDYQKPVRMAGTTTEITEKKEQEERDRFISEASIKLSATLDYKSTLRQIAHLAVPQLACWCTIDLIEGESIRRVAVVHKDPDLAELVKNFEDLPVDLDAPGGASKVIRSGKSVLFPPEKSQEISEEYDEVPMIGTKDPKQIQTIKQFGLRSYVSTLIRSRHEPLGVLTLVRGPMVPPFAQKDVKFIEELAGRAALAIDNASLYLKAQEAIQAREDMISFVSHDLKNPLAAISLSSGQLRKTITSRESWDAAEKAVERIHTATKSMQRLLNDVLDVTKIKSGTFAITSDQENLHSLVNETIELMQVSAAEKSIRIKKRIENECSWIQCDRPQISRVLANLISNSIKFTPIGGEIVIQVSCSEETRFSVTDNGSGIPEDQLVHIFERFWQAKETAPLGTGLGLSIAKGIVEAHRGKIWVESKVGRGSTFLFTIPNISKKAA